MQNIESLEEHTEILWWNLFSERCCSAFVNYVRLLLQKQPTNARTLLAMCAYAVAIEWEQNALPKWRNCTAILRRRHILSSRCMQHWRSQWCTLAFFVSLALLHHLRLNNPKSRNESQAALLSNMCVLLSLSCVCVSKGAGTLRQIGEDACVGYKGSMLCPRRVAVCQIAVCALRRSGDIPTANTGGDLMRSLAVFM